jgi:hypothetical protein
MRYWGALKGQRVERTMGAKGVVENITYGKADWRQGLLARLRSRRTGISICLHLYAKSDHAEGDYVHIFAKKVNAQGFNAYGEDDLTIYDGPLSSLLEAALNLSKSKE